MKKIIDFIFVGTCSDFIFAKNYLNTNTNIKAIFFTDLPSDNLEDYKNKICQTEEDLLSNVEEGVLVVASSFSTSKQMLYNALAKKCHLFLLNYKDLELKDYDSLYNYSLEMGVAFLVPIFAASKAILLKKMITLYTKDLSLNISINDNSHDFLDSDLFLLALNIINRKHIDDIEIKKSALSLKIITKKYKLSFTNNAKEPLEMKGKTNGDEWSFDWNILADLQTKHQSGVKEHYAFIDDHGIENIYKNMYAHCLSISPMLYTTVSDLYLYLKIKDAYLSMKNNTSIKFSL